MIGVFLTETGFLFDDVSRRELVHFFDRIVPRELRLFDSI